MYSSFGKSLEMLYPCDNRPWLLFQKYWIAFSFFLLEKYKGKHFFKFLALFCDHLVAFHRYDVVELQIR